MANPVIREIQTLVLRTTLAMLTLALVVTSAWAATGERVLHNLGSTGDGHTPYSSVVFDTHGNIYGTTYQGGSHNNEGVAFEMTPNGSGGYIEKVIHNFGSGMDAQYPNTLIFDSAGKNLYGTAEYGGSHGFGAVFEMSPDGSGGWTEKVIHNFGSGVDGQYPLVNLIFDSAGNLYSTTSGGGAKDKGTVFEMSPNGSGGWTERVLHSFRGDADGIDPQGVIFDTHGNLFGATTYGGNLNQGTAFELSPDGSGGYTEKVIHNFGHGDDGQTPISGFLMDSAGNFYGATYGGGLHGDGTVYEISPSGGGDYTEKVLHDFGGLDDGANPYADLLFDTKGNLYGTTYGGGTVSCKGGVGCGTLFEMLPNGDGGYDEKVLWNFGDGLDGTAPSANLIFDKSGNLYSTTPTGGSHNNGGTVFEYTPE